MDRREEIGQMMPDRVQKMSCSINADVMNVAEIHQKLEVGYQDAKNENGYFSG